uniref:Uncharacterized protein n=1 Tax=Aegilops tauschii TaxID=37682 RepID=M8D288_AEGTA
MRSCDDGLGSTTLVWEDMVGWVVEDNTWVIGVIGKSKERNLTPTFLELGVEEAVSVPEVKGGNRSSSDLRSCSMVRIN